MKLPTLAALLSLAAACSADVDPRDVEPTADDRSAACLALDERVAKGVLAIVNDEATDFDALDDSVASGGAGLITNAASSIVENRPFEDIAALDDAPWIGDATCRALARWACNERHACNDELTVATWNVEHFPKSSATEDGVVSVVDQLALDFVGIEEIEAKAPFDRVLADLPGHHGVLGRAADTRVGAIVRDEALAIVDVAHLFGNDGWAFPRPVLVVRAQLPAHPEIGDIQLVVVHLKAMTDAESESRRKSAIVKLRAWIDARRSAGDTNIILLGDFNDEIDDVGTHDVFAPLKDPAAKMIAITESLADDGEFSFVPFQRLIDHVLVSEELLTAFDGADVRALHLEQTWNGDYLDDISDHRPVVVTFGVPVRFD
ncbi:MAG TPA: endonuclease/exonuclease/phosphatase family protein [Nannocystaceae bacterium]|nr:endonuclease/exonuclease/phosphatase family protein [Nannocystaceae bacterium]